MFTSKHFELEEIKNGVYAAIARDGGGAIANSGIIDMGEYVVIFDTCNTQQAAKDLKNAAETITGKRIGYVINSHWHGDHIRGNQVFAGIPILSSKRTYEIMSSTHPERIEQQKNRLPELLSYIESLENKLSDSDDNAPSTRELSNQISFLKELAVSLHSLQLQLPTETFSYSHTIQGSTRQAQLITYGGGHTQCDSFLYLPDVGILFAGDLVSIYTHPAFQDGDPVSWMNILEKLQQLDFSIIVPGHGPVGTKQDVEIIKDYINTVQRLVGLSEQEGKINIPEMYSHWSHPEIFEANLAFVKKLRGK